MMIEVVVLQHLASVLDVPVYMERPENVQGAFVLLEKTGSSRTNKVNKATFACQSYAPSMYKAAELNEQVKSAMDSLIESDLISESALNSDYNFTDTADKSYRYQAVYDLVY